MNYETRAIPLLYHKYGDGAVIAKIFTGLVKEKEVVFTHNVEDPWISR